MIKEVTHWIPTPALQALDDELSTVTPHRHQEERSDVMIQLNNSEITHWIPTPALQALDDDTGAIDDAGIQPYE